MQLGITMFGDSRFDLATNQIQSPEIRMKEIIEEIFDHIKSKAEEILDPIKSNISQLISPQIHGIVVSFDYLAFHVSLVDERAITGRFNYLIMSKDHEQEFMEKIKLTLGTSF